MPSDSWFTEFYSDLPVWGLVGLYLATMVFVLQILGSLVLITKDVVINYIITEMGGLKGFVAWIASRLGIALLWGGFANLILIVIIVPFIILEGSIHNPSALISQAFVGVAFVAAGGLIYRLCASNRQPEPPGREELARKRAAASRWGRQWLYGSVCAALIFPLLPLLVAMPPWLAEPWNAGEILIAAAIGTVWAFADLFSGWAKTRPS
jgi:hypothetical protein